LQQTTAGPRERAGRSSFGRLDSRVPLPGEEPVLSVPIFVYRFAMLAWALWLALALLRWLRWGWESLTAGGGWRPLRPAIPPQPAPAPGLWHQSGL
jgi:hypothetical protein